MFDTKNTSTNTKNNKNIDEWNFIEIFNYVSKDTEKKIKSQSSDVRKYFEEYKPYETHKNAAEYLTNPKIVSEIDKYSNGLLFLFISIH